MGSARLPAFSPVVSSISFCRMALRPLNSTLVSKGISRTRKVKRVLPALGRCLIVKGSHVGKPLGPHQGLEVGFDLLLIERLADPAQELGLDLFGRMVAFPSNSILEIVPSGNRSPCAGPRWD